MPFHIPFTFSEIPKLKTRSKRFLSLIKHKKDSTLSKNLASSGIGITREEYLAIVLRNFTIIFIYLLIIFTTALWLFNVTFFYLLGFALALIFGAFIFFSQIVYPRIYITRKQRRIEKNLLPALEDISIQLNSGIPLFSIMVNIAYSDYGDLSKEFKEAVKKISAGEPQTEVLEEIGQNNPSILFRRVLWQISNGMKAGSDMAIVIKDGIRALNEEQMIQIQNYGNKLNPLIMFYMLTSIIIPALSVTFLTILSSMLGLQKNVTIMIFLGLFVVVIFIQIMFIGLIKSKRPSLL